MNTIGFIGLGLIGGSIAKAARKAHPDLHILAYNRSREPLLQALKDGVIDAVLEENDSRLTSCDFLFLCAPVEYNLSLMERLAKKLDGHCILTDVGSVKGPIHKRAEELGIQASFIGGHPMAGSEKTGYLNSSDRLLENAYYILTPGDGVPLERLGELTELVSSIGSIPLVLTSEEHDFITAGVSHLPQLIASSLVNLVKELDNEAEYMKMIAAGGFRDITRIASSSPDMWEQICLENKDNISNVLDDYIRMLIQLRCNIDASDGPILHQMFESARDYRDSIDVRDNGLLRKIHMLYIDLADEAGGIATIATLLALEGISIKNIGIIHNREFEQGVLKIEFYNNEDCEASLRLLRKRNYTVYER